MYNILFFYYQVDNDTFRIRYAYVSEEGEEKMYDDLVDLSVGMCTCPRGATGGMCKHQAALKDRHPQPERGQSRQQKEQLYWIATGTR